MGKAAGFGGAERADDNVNVRAPGAVFSYGDFSDAQRDRAGGRGAEQRGAEAGRHGVEQSVCGRLRCGKERIREEADAQRRSSFRCGRRCIGRGRCEERYDISERGGVTNGAAGCQNGRMCCQSEVRNLPKAGWHTD